MLNKFINRALCSIILICTFVTGMWVQPPEQPVFIYPDVRFADEVVAKRIQASTAYIEADYWSGSGVLLDGGIVLTAGHVVEDANSFTIKFNDGTTVISTEYYTENDADVGFIKIDATKVEHLRTVDFASKIELGEDVFICGCPFGYELAYSVTFGKISGLEREIPFFGKMTMIQSDAQIWPGNSGGPAVNRNGKLIGIAVGGMRGYDGIALIVPFETCELSLNKYLAELNLEKEYAI